MSFQTQPLFQDSLTQGILAALNDVLVLPLSNSSGAIVNISDTWVGTIVLEGSNDGFATYQNAALFTPPAGVISNGVTANGYYRLVAVSGFTQLRARMSSYTSGSAIVVISASIGSGLAPTVSVNYDSMLGTSKITGNTDATKIGNVGDRLKVDASFSSVPRTTPSYAGVKTRILDMNVSNGGVARDTGINSTSSYTTIFNYSGSGNIFNLLVQFEGNLIGADSFNLKLEIDGSIVFEISTLDVGTGALYGLGTDGNENTMGMSVSNNVFKFAVPRGVGLSYSSNIKVSIKKETSTSSKKFRAGMIFMTKDT